MKKIKIGVFGAGRGSCMIDVLFSHPEAEIVAVCDTLFSVTWMPLSSQIMPMSMHPMQFDCFDLGVML